MCVLHLMNCLTYLFEGFIFFLCEYMCVAICYQKQADLAIVARGSHSRSDIETKKPLVCVSESACKCAFVYVRINEYECVC